MKSNLPRIPHMRTVTEAAQELKALDPSTAMTPYHIRQLCLTGVLPTIKAGKKILLDLNLLVEYLQNPNAEKFKPATEQSASGKSGVIRRIPEKG